jgi:hypothetical protein
VSVAQRRGFRECLTGLLQPRERNKTLTALAGAEPVVQAGHPGLLTAEAATRPHERGVLVADDTGDRKDGPAYTPAGRLPGGDTDPDFATKAQLAVRLAQRARAAGIRYPPSQPAREGDPSTIHSRRPAARARPANHDAVLAEYPATGPWMVDPHHTASRPNKSR